MGFARNTVSVLATTTVVMVLRLVIVVVLARLMTPADLGRYSVTTNFAMVSMLIAQLGLSSASIYRIRRLREPADRVTGSLLLVTVVIGAISCAVLFLSEDLIAERLFSGAPPYVYRLGVALSVFLLLGMVFSGVATALDHFDLANRYALTASLIQLLGMIAVLGPLRGELREALIVTVAGELIASCALVASVVRVTGFSLVSWRERLGTTLRYGAKSYAQSVTVYLHEQVAVFMLALLLTDTGPIAIFTVALSITTRLKLIPGAVASAAFPQFAGLEDEGGAALAARATRYSFACVALMSLLVAAASPLVVPLAFGSQYRASVPILMILLPGMALLTNFMLLGRYFMAIDRQQVSIATQAVSLVLNIALNLFLIPRYGIGGAAWAGLVSYTLEFLLITVAFARATGRSAAHTLLLTRADLRDLVDRMRQWRRRIAAGTPT